MLNQLARGLSQVLLIAATFNIALMSQFEADAALIGVVAPTRPERERLAYESVENALERKCHDVEPLAPGDLQHISDYGGIVITPLFTPESDVEDFLRENPSSPEPVPVILWNSALWEEFQFSDIDGNVMSSPNGVSLVSSAPAGEASRLLNSLPPYVTLGGDMQVDIRPWAKLQFGPDIQDVRPTNDGGAHVIGSRHGESLAAIAVNDPQIDPPTRIALPFSSDALRFATRAGYQLFDTAVEIAFGGGICSDEEPPTAQPPVAGDANLDGIVCSNDLVAMLSAGKYETGRPGTWFEGDFDGNGFVESGDLVTAFTFSATIYETAPGCGVPASIMPVTQVPEPGTTWLALFLGCRLLMRLRRRRS